VIAGQWLFGSLTCDVFNANDVLFSTASLLHLCCISWDRYIAVTDPFGYERRMTRRRAALTLAGVWTASACLSHIPIHLGLYTTASQRDKLAADTDECSFKVGPPSALQLHRVAQPVSADADGTRATVGRRAVYRPGGWTSSAINSRRSVVDCRPHLPRLPSLSGAVNTEPTAVAVYVVLADVRSAFCGQMRAAVAKFLPELRYASAGISCRCTSVCLSITCRYCIETAVWIELISCIQVSFDSCYTLFQGNYGI